MAPFNIDQTLALAIEKHRAGDFKAAEGLYKAVLLAQPQQPDANHNMGVLALDTGVVEQSLDFFKTALAANPNAAQFWLSLIDALIMLEMFADARALLDRAKTSFVHEDAFVSIEHKLDQAADGQVFKGEPPHDLLRPLIELDAEVELQAHLETVRLLIKQYPYSCILQTILGVALRQNGDLEAAIGAYKNAIIANPNYADAHYNMGNALTDQGRLEEAVENYNRALDIQPNNAKALNNRGNALHEQGKLTEAIYSYEKSIEINSLIPEVHFNLGKALKDLGKLEEALEAFNNVVSIQSDYQNVDEIIGSLLLDLGRTDEGKLQLNKAHGTISL
jgi:tetratricopeptide (TPR) repeat protein